MAKQEAKLDNIDSPNEVVVATLVARSIQEISEFFQLPEEVRNRGKGIIAKVVSKETLAYEGGPYIRDLKELALSRPNPTPVEKILEETGLLTLLSRPPSETLEQITVREVEETDWAASWLTKDGERILYLLDTAPVDDYKTPLLHEVLHLMSSEKFGGRCGLKSFSSNGDFFFVHLDEAATEILRLWYEITHTQKDPRRVMMSPRMLANIVMAGIQEEADGKQLPIRYHIESSLSTMALLAVISMTDEGDEPMTLNDLVNYYFGLKEKQNSTPIDFLNDLLGRIPERLHSLAIEIVTDGKLFI